MRRIVEARPRDGDPAEQGLVPFSISAKTAVHAVPDCLGGGRALRPRSLASRSPREGGPLSRVPRFLFWATSSPGNPAWCSPRTVPGQRYLRGLWSREAGALLAGQHEACADGRASHTDVHPVNGTPVGALVTPRLSTCTGVLGNQGTRALSCRGGALRVHGEGRVGLTCLGVAGGHCAFQFTAGIGTEGLAGPSEHSSRWIIESIENSRRKQEQETVSVGRKAAPPNPEHAYPLSLSPS